MKMVLPALALAFMVIVWLFLLTLRPELKAPLRAVQARAGAALTWRVAEVWTAPVRLQVLGTVSATPTPEPRTEDLPTVRLHIGNSKRGKDIEIKLTGTHHHGTHNDFVEWEQMANSKHFEGMNDHERFLRSLRTRPVAAPAGAPLYDRLSALPGNGTGAGYRQVELVTA